MFSRPLNQYFLYDLKLNLNVALYPFIGGFMKEFFTVKYGEVPLLGVIAFGIIDRGTNLIQVRPQSGCPLCCIYCSVDEGSCSRTRMTVYRVEKEYLVDVVKEVVRFKGADDIEIHIDGTGEPFLYDKIDGLIGDLREIEGVKVISAQTSGFTISKKMVPKLEEAGLSRVNLSINSLDQNLAKKMAGIKSYNIDKILVIAEEIAESQIDLLIAPVWVPKVNDAEIPKLIEYAIKIGAGKNWPPLGIQKYIAHKRGRKVKGVKPMSWFKFYRKLASLEKIYGVKLILGREDFNIHRTKRKIPVVFKKLEKVKVKIVGPGWIKGEKIGISRGRAVTVVNCKAEAGETVRVRILSNKDGIYLAEPA